MSIIKKVAISGSKSAVVFAHKNVPIRTRVCSILRKFYYKQQDSSYVFVIELKFEYKIV